jgi:hypothetical protein
VRINWTGKPDVDYMDHLPENGGVRGRTLFPKKDDGKQGWGVDMIAHMERWVRSRGAKIFTGYRASSLIMEDSGRVAGVTARSGDYEMRLRARMGVVFCSGGYTHNPEFLRNFQPGPVLGGCATPTNTGDFIPLACSAGAKLGNMNGAFRSQIIFEKALAEPEVPANIFYIPGDSAILVDRHGQRIMDEKRNYNDRARMHFEWDAQNAEWRNLLTFMLFDQRCADLWQGSPPFPKQGKDAPLPGYLMKADTWEGLCSEISGRLGMLSRNTGGFSLDRDFPDNLKRTVDEFNAYAGAGKDSMFHRGDYTYDREWTTFPPRNPDAVWPPEGSKNPTMHPLGEGPFYAIILASGTLDTNGGPVIDGNGRVLGWDDIPIEGLYGAGNCIASPTAGAYWGGGSTIGPALTFGRLAALHATRGM